jgi:plastocyanin
MSDGCLFAADATLARVPWANLDECQLRRRKENIMSTTSIFRKAVGTATRAGCLSVLALVFILAPAAAEPIYMKSGPNRYEPKTKTVKVGDTVEWVNEAGSHTVTPDDGQPDPFKGSQTLSPGQKYSIVISGTPRTIKYHCEVHGPSMSGEIVVAP